MALGWLSRLRRENSQVARRERQDAIAKALTQSLRTLSTVFTAIADRVESNRLKENGYSPNSFLQRTDRGDRKQG